MDIKAIQVMVDEGKDAYEHGEYHQAAEAFLNAQREYQALGEELMAAETANNLSVALLQAGDPEAALNALENTEELFLQAGQIKNQAVAAGNRASALDALKRFEEAEAEYERCADLLDQAGETELRAHVLKSLSAIQIRRGKQIDALINMQAGIRGKKKPSLRERLLSKLLELPFKFGPR